MSQPFILGSMLVSIADTSIASLTNPKNAGRKTPALRIVVGGWAVTVALLIVSERNEKFANSAALLILLATLVGPNNGALAEAILKLSAPNAGVTGKVSTGTPAVPTLKLS